jgi:ribosomal protein uS17
MADEKTNQTEDLTEEPTDDAPAEDVAPEAGAEAEAPVAEAESPADAEDAPENEASAEEAPAEAEAPAEEAAEEAPAAEAEAPAAEEAAVEEEAAPAEAAEGAPEAGAAPEAPAAPPKKKRKRLPRPLRRQRSKPVRERAEGRKPLARLPKPEHARGPRQERRGVVVSNQMDKTIVVRVETLKAHRRYKKIIRRSTKFHAHDEANQAKVGDVVRIVETRPLSKTKRWRLAEIVEEAK